jgi:DNA repair exonuclease SbcCD ATPase subunit
VKKALRLARVPALTLAALVLTSCAWKKDVDQLKAENKTLSEEKQRSQRELGAAGAATAEMQATLDEVQRSLEDLRVKELRAVKTSIAIAQEGKTAAAQKRDELKAEIEEIRNSVKANLAKLSALQKQNRAFDEKATTLERLVGELRRSLEEKEATIAALEQKAQELTKTTEELRGAVKEKEATVKEKEAVIADRETQMSTAYVLIAPQRALKKAGLVEKKGSVLGLGGNWQRTGQFDETLFKQIDTRKETEFAVDAAPDKARVLSDHPKDSYTLSGTGPKASMLSVTDAARFWKGSKYLVVMLPD